MKKNSLPFFFVLLATVLFFNLALLLLCFIVPLPLCTALGITVFALFFCVLVKNRFVSLFFIVFCTLTLAEYGFEKAQKVPEKAEYGGYYFTDSLGIWRAGINGWNPHHSINSNGFPSREFSDTTKGDRVLFVGDSYTWGASATDTNSFVQLVENAGFVTYNTGIPGADLAQYLRVAEVYIPQIKPEVVYLGFCMDNDFIYAERNIYTQHLGFDVSGKIHGVYRPELPGVGVNSWDDFIACGGQPPFNCKGLCNARAHGVLTNLFLTVSEKFYYSLFVDKKDPSTVNNYLSKIRNLALKNGARFKILLIPSHRGAEHLFENEAIFRKKFPDLMNEFDPLIIPDLKLKDYTPHGTHWNDSGHRKAAEIILQDIR